ncbi:hypothetical protein Dimus_015014 [Dionaea muscipula]
MHHGGRVSPNPQLGYIGGRKSCFDNCSALEMSLTKLGTMSTELGYGAKMAFYWEVHVYIGDAIGSQEIKTPQTPHLVDVELGEEANYSSDEN